MIEAPLRPEDAPASLYGPDGNPQFFNDPAMDRMVAVVLNLASEVWVQAEKITTLREVVERHGGVSESELAELTERSATDPARDAELHDFIGRVFAPLREATGG